MFIAQFLVSALALGASIGAALPVTVQDGAILSSREFDGQDILVKRVTTSWKPSAQAATHPADQAKAQQDIQAHVHRLAMEGHPMGAADHAHIWKEQHPTTNPHTGQIMDPPHVSVDFKRGGQNGQNIPAPDGKHVYPGGVSTGHAWANIHANDAARHDANALHHAGEAQRHGTLAATARHPQLAAQHQQQANFHAQQAQAATQAGKASHQQAAAHHQGEANRQGVLAAQHGQAAQYHLTQAAGHFAASQNPRNHPQVQAHHLTLSTQHQADATAAGVRAQHATNMQAFHQTHANDHAARG